MLKKATAYLLILLSAACLLVSCQSGQEPAGAASSDPTGQAEESAAQTEPEKTQTAGLEITICTPVATGINIVGGLCSRDCTAVEITGDGIDTKKIIPDYLTDSGYFIGQVKIDESCEISAKELYEDGSSSEAVQASAVYTQMKNLMTADEYAPVFGENSRMHFYSAILSYTLSDVLNDSIRDRAHKNIAANISVLKEANPEAELIYLVIPSSAAVYPETVPAEYVKAEGKTVFEEFQEIATAEGATVLYPLDAFTQHKQDGLGYKIYNNTDSHWSTYGAYLGLCELMNHIAQKNPAAAPRTTEEMEFYTEALWGGDSLFSFGDNGGFENYSKTASTGKTELTKISELTTLYKLKMPTNTLDRVYRNGKSTYVNGTNSSSATITNPNGEGLPTALICRDSFACTAYDMVNDRFSTVYWQNSHSYGLQKDTLKRVKPDYVIYLISERNLLKVIFENDNISICNYAK